MHVGKRYPLREVLKWTRKDILILLAIAFAPTAAYTLLGWQWLAIPWYPVALLGTAVAFIVGFKNNASYDRLWEARKIWGAIVNTSRAWGLMVNDFVQPDAGTPPQEQLRAHQEQLALRHFAWLTALRFSLRERRTWETIYQPENTAFRERWFHVEEQNGTLKSELQKYLSPAELEEVLQKSNRAAAVLALQSQHLRMLFNQQVLNNFRFIEMERTVMAFLDQQGGCERIKNFPYPRQYATANQYFTRVFVLLIPLGMLQEFHAMGDYLVWLTVPFSALAAWIFTTMEKIGESSENPFEGSANDVPITTISRAIEIDLRQTLRLGDVPEPIQPENNILV